MTIICILSVIPVFICRLCHVVINISVYLSYCHVVDIRRTDCESIYQLFVEVVQVTDGESYVHQQYPTDNVDNVK